MAKQNMQVTFTFIDPNKPKSFERLFQKIVVDKLLWQYKQSCSHRN